MRVDLLRPFELYVMDDTGGIRTMSRGWRRLDTAPQWSPDGARLTYTSGYGEHIYLVNADGSGRREIAPEDGLKTLVRWSPAGSRLAYVRAVGGSGDAATRAYELCVVELQTGRVERLAASNVRDYVWTQDGGALVAVVRTDGSHQIETHLADGIPVLPSVEAAYLEDAIATALAPDAAHIAYVVPGSAADDGTFVDALRISRIDGSDAAAVDVRWMDGSLAWSPDGSRLAFVALTGDYAYALCVVSGDGTGLRQLVDLNAGDDSGEILPAVPAWSPDGTQIAIGLQVDPDRSAILVVDVEDGTVREFVSMEEGMVYDVAWRPRK
jgi:Tol biopolymer transport system component